MYSFLHGVRVNVLIQTAVYPLSDLYKGEADRGRNDYLKLVFGLSQLYGQNKHIMEVHAYF